MASLRQVFKKKKICSLMSEFVIETQKKLTKKSKINNFFSIFVFFAFCIVLVVFEFFLQKKKLIQKNLNKKNEKKNCFHLIKK